MHRKKTDLFFEYFCNINGLDRDGLSELDGAFRKM